MNTWSYPAATMSDNEAVREFSRKIFKLPRPCVWLTPSMFFFLNNRRQYEIANHDEMWCIKESQSDTRGEP